MTDKPIQAGDLVTVSLGEYQVISNTYRVARKLDGESVLSHPLAPDCFILRKDTDLNQTFPSMQSAVEKCLVYAQKNRDLLSHTMKEDLDALCFYIVIKKSLTPKQRTELANICGKIASIHLNYSLSSAIASVKANKALLDDYTLTLFNNSKRSINDPHSIDNKIERYKIFSIAGFVLAQLSNS
jgi:hypothetical protein